MGNPIKNNQLPLTTYYMEEKVTVGRRIGSMIIDYFSMPFLIILFYIPTLIAGFPDRIMPSHTYSEPVVFSPWLFLGLFGFSLFFNKDIVFGRSFGKYATSLQVIKNGRSEPASPLRCFVRNITIIFSPIEFIVVLINPTRRLGDFIAGTRIEKYKLVNDQQRFNWRQGMLAIVLSYVLVVSILFILTGGFNQNRIIIDETSVNEEMGLEIQKLIEDSLSSYCSPDVKVYNRVNNDTIKFISTILYLNEDYFCQGRNTSEIEAKAKWIILKRYPNFKYHGQIHCIIERQGHTNWNTIYFSKNIE